MRIAINITWKNTGSSLIEVLVILPVFLLISLGIVQLAFIYEAKTSLNYAAFMSARSGSTNHADTRSLLTGLVKSITPLYAPGKNRRGILMAEKKALDDIKNHSSIRIINPTREAFQDFAVRDPYSNRIEIPNAMLHIKSTNKGVSSGLNIQDANILKIRVIYGYKLKVPFVNKMITTIVRSFTTNPEKRSLLTNGRLPIQATATVRMQSSARLNDWVLARQP